MYLNVLINNKKQNVATLKLLFVEFHAGNRYLKIEKDSSKSTEVRKNRLVGFPEVGLVRRTSVHV